MSTDELLVGYYKATLKANNYIDVAQLKWVFQKVADKLGWQPVELP